MYSGNKILQHVQWILNQSCHIIDLHGRALTPSIQYTQSPNEAFWHFLWCSGGRTINVGWWSHMAPFTWSLASLASLAYLAILASLAPLVSLTYKLASRSWLWKTYSPYKVGSWRIGPVVCTQKNLSKSTKYSCKKLPWSFMWSNPHDIEDIFTLALQIKQSNSNHGSTCTMNTVLNCPCTMNEA